MILNVSIIISYLIVLLFTDPVLSGEANVCQGRVYDIGTYVTVHTYTDAAVRQAVEAGVGSIEHGPFLTEETMKLMAEKGVFLAPTARLSLTTPEELALEPGTVTYDKMVQVNAGATQQLEWARQYNVPMVFSTDQFGSRELFARQSDEFLTLSEVLDQVEVLKMATSNIATLLELTGELPPYKTDRSGLSRRVPMPTFFWSKAIRPPMRRSSRTTRITLT